MKSANAEVRWSAETRPGIRIAQAANRLYTRLYHRVTTLAPPQIPRSGPAILVSNHVSGLDPMLIQSAVPRMIVWMMAKEYFDIKGLRWFFEQIEAIPVERSGRDLTATRSALRVLHEGRVLGIFPEGRIETDHDLLPFQTGVSLMAMKTGTPVYPTYLDGTQRGREMVDAFMWPSRAQLSFGPPITFERGATSRESLDHATDRIQQAVFSLRQAVESNKMRC